MGHKLAAIGVAILIVMILLAHQHHTSKGNDDPTAQCVDGSYSHSQTHQGTCSHHGGVAQWLDDGTGSGSGGNEPSDVEGPDVCYGRGGASAC